MARLRSALASPISQPSETQHGIPFVSAVERGRVVGAQFHPELSGSLGRGILKVSVVSLCLIY